MSIERDPETGYLYYTSYEDLNDMEWREVQNINLDVGLLNKAVEWAENQHDLMQRTGDSEWCQSSWAVSYSCGSAFCIAGNIANQAPNAELLWNEGLDEAEYVLRSDGVIQRISSFALEQLGIRDDHELFNGNNEIEDIRQIRDELIYHYVEAE